jgi:hypothetical protein
MQQSELVAISGKFRQGLERLKRLEKCLEVLAGELKLSIDSHQIDSERGELVFVFAGMSFYIRIRVTDRHVDDVGTEYRVPIGWLDWGRLDENDRRDAPIQSSFYDDRGILCEFGKEEFYCSFDDCSDERARRGMLVYLSTLVGRSIALNNAV